MLTSFNEWEKTRRKWKECCKGRHKGGTEGHRSGERTSSRGKCGTGRLRQLVNMSSDVTKHRQLDRVSKIFNMFKSLERLSPLLPALDMFLPGSRWSLLMRCLVLAHFAHVLCFFLAKRCRRTVAPLVCLANRSNLVSH